MKFQQYNLGHQTRGTVVEVTLSGSAANVRLLDSTNFQSYRSGRRHQYIGGLITKSPAQLTIPRTGSWHVTVDMRGLRGQTRSSIRVIPREAITPLPEYSPTSTGKYGPDLYILPTSLGPSLLLSLRATMYSYVMLRRTKMKLHALWQTHW